MKIAVDAMGGDFAPEAIVEGVVMAAAELPETTTIVLIGKQFVIENLLQKYGATGAATIELVNASTFL